MDGHVAIMMATFNGARWLPDQLNSLLDQDHKDWSLWVSDDGSTDGTWSLIEEFGRANPGHPVHLMDGPGNGPTRNFLSLADKVDADAEAFAFCDQDDVWMPHRLSHGLSILRGAGEGPTLVGHRTEIVDESLRREGLSPRFARAPCFENALVQSIAGGNTMLMNRAALDLLRRAGSDLDVVTHDWWAYQLVTGAGGRVIYDERPALLYRQHDGNLIGSNAGWAARVRRIRALFAARFHDWNSRNLAALEHCEQLLAEPARDRVTAFRNLRHLRGLRAMTALHRSGLIRQTRLGTASLYLAAALGKL